MFTRLSVQYCMFLWTSLTWRHWDARSTISEWQPKHRPAISERPSSSPTATAHHGTDEHRLKRHSPSATLQAFMWTETRCFLKSTDKRSLRPNNKTKLLSDIRDAPTSRREVREICRWCHWYCLLCRVLYKTSMRRSANGRNTWNSFNDQWWWRREIH